MTVIVYKDGILAADRSCSADGKHLYENCKIVTGGNTIGAGSGSITALANFEKWVESGMTTELRNETGDDMLGIAVSGNAVYIVSDGVAVRVPSDHAHVAGTGAEVALGALDMGASAPQAALIAARRMGCAQYGIDVCSPGVPITRIYAPEGKLNVNTF
jgi:hypothetical protein